MAVARRFYNYPTSIDPALLRVLEQRDSEQSVSLEQLNRLQSFLWTDYHLGAINISLLGAAADPTRDTDDGSLLFSGTQINVVATEMQAPHGWIVGDTLIPHIHWMRTSNSSSAVTWEMRYRWSSYNTVRSAWSSWTAGTISTSTTDTGTLDKELITTWSITEATALISSNFIFNIRRRGDTDAETATARLLAFDVHYRSDTRGSVSQYSKNS